MYNFELIELKAIMESNIMNDNDVILIMFFFFFFKEMFHLSF